MSNTVSARVDNGLEVLLRVVGVLKRKRFNIKSLNMEEIKDSSYASLVITFDDELSVGAQRAISQMEKLVDVHEVKELSAIN